MSLPVGRVNLKGGILEANQISSWNRITKSFDHSIRASYASKLSLLLIVFNGKLHHQSSPNSALHL
jgi:hypothetical protein